METSLIDGIISSGPGIVHDDDASDSVDCDGSLSWFVWTGPGRGLGLAGSEGESWVPSDVKAAPMLFGGVLGSLSLKEAVDAITQDSPNAARSGVRGGPVDMAL